MDLAKLDDTDDGDYQANKGIGHSVLCSFVLPYEYHHVVLPFLDPCSRAAHRDSTSACILPLRSHVNNQSMVEYACSGPACVPSDNSYRRCRRSAALPSRQYRRACARIYIGHVLHCMFN